MNSDFDTFDKHLPLPQVLKFIVDNRGKTVPTADSGIPLIATNCIKDDELYPVYEKIRYVSEATHKNWFRSHPLPGDIIFVNKGTPGRVCLVPEPVGFCIAQDMMAFRVDEEKIYNKYLFAVLKSRQFQLQIEQLHVGTLIPHFKKGDLDKLLIPVPVMEVQKKIGDLYFILFNKIELNNRMNKTLEEMAQAIFKSWFIDFEPFQDGEFLDSEMGRIPKGWHVGTISELGEVIGGSTPSKTNLEFYTTNGISWITPKDLSIFKRKFVSRGQVDISEEGYKNSSTKKMPSGTVLFSSRAPIGYIAIAMNEVTTNQGFKSIVPKKNIGTSYIYSFLRNNLESIVSRASGSTFMEISGSVMKQIPALIPADPALISFQNQTNMILDMQEEIESQNEVLSSLRDTLLPKLMSGEIRVPIQEE